MLYISSCFTVYVTINGKLWAPKYVPHNRWSLLKVTLFYDFQKQLKKKKHVNFIGFLSATLKM